jgi:hypothetical protein
MNEEVVGRLVGFAHWGDEAFLNRQEYEMHKAEVTADLRANRAAGFEVNQHLVGQLKTIISRKQHQMNVMKMHTYEEVQHAMEEMLPLFAKMHAELFVKEIDNSLIGIHKNTVAMHDAVTRQSRILDAMDASSYEDLIPHLFYLYDKEKQLQCHIQRHAKNMHKNAVKLVKHMNGNYFGRLSRVANTEEFHKAHGEVFTAAYLLSVASRAIAKVQGNDTRELHDLETAFMSNIAPYGR